MNNLTEIFSLQDSRLKAHSRISSIGSVQVSPICRERVLLHFIEPDGHHLPGGLIIGVDELASIADAAKRLMDAQTNQDKLRPPAIVAVHPVHPVLPVPDNA